MEYWFNEYDKEVKQYEELLTKLKSLLEASNQRLIEMAVKDCDAKGNRAKEIKKSFDLELKLTRDKAVRADYEARVKDHENRFKALEKEFLISKAKSNKNSLFGDVVPTYMQSAEGKNNDDLLSDTHKIQELTMESVYRTKNMIEASKEIGTSTLQQIIAQKEQMIEIEKDIDLMDSNLVRAEKLVSNFAKRMATDRIIQLFASVNIVVLLGLILYVAVSGRTLTTIGQTGGSGTGPAVSRAPSFRPTMIPSMIPTGFPTQ